MKKRVRAVESELFGVLRDAEVGTVGGDVVVTWKLVEVGEQVRSAYKFRRLTIKKERES